MTARGRGAAAPGLLRGGSALAVALRVANVSTYAFTMIAARVLGPRDYGAFAALMATLLVFGVLQLGLQATAARRISAQPEHVAQIEHSILRVTYRASLAIGIVLLVASPLVKTVLRLDSIWAAILVAVAVVPTSLMGGQAGILQGERRWVALGAVYFSAGVPRLVVGTLMLLWVPSVEAAMSAVAICAWVPVVVGWLILRDKREPGTHPDHGSRSMIRESIHNSAALLAFFALSNLDIVVARNVLSDHDAGLYAAGLILSKAVLFLPQFVVIVAFPSLSTQAERRHALMRSLGLIAALGLIAIAGAALLSSLAITFVGGEKYVEIESSLWIFATTGTALAMLQLLIYAVLARQGQRSVYAVWLALAVMIGVGLTTSSIAGLLTVVLTVDVVLVAALLLASLSILRQPEPTPEPVGATN